MGVQYVKPSSTRVNGERVHCVRLGKKILLRHQTKDEQAANEARLGEYRRGYMNGLRAAMEEIVRQMGIVTRTQSDDRLNGLMDSLEGIINTARHHTRGH